MRRNDKQTALDAFIARKFEIDTMLERLKTLSDEHFGIDPDDFGYPVRLRTLIADELTAWRIGHRFW